MIISMQKMKIFNLCCDYHSLVAFSSLLKDFMFNLSIGGLWVRAREVGERGHAHELEQFWKHTWFSKLLCPSGLDRVTVIRPSGGQLWPVEEELGMEIVV